MQYCPRNRVMTDARLQCSVTAAAFVDVLQAYMHDIPARVLTRMRSLLDVHIEAAVMVQTETGVTLPHEAVTSSASLSLAYQLALSA